MNKVLFTATVDSHILHFHIPYLKYFKDLGYEVHVATNSDEKIPYCDKKYKIDFEKNPLNLKNVKAIFKLRKVLNDEKYELIHTHTPMGSVVTRIASILSSKSKKARLIYTAHGFHFYKGASFINWLIFYNVEKILAKYTDTLILINEEDYNLAKSKFSKYCDDILLVKGVGVDINKYSHKLKNEEKFSILNSLELSPNNFIMIYPAELSKRKRQLWLIKSLENYLLNNREVVLILPGNDLLSGECQEYVKNRKLEKQIKLLGYRTDVNKLLGISDVSISSSSQEGLPVNIIEAMIAGLPIIASNCRGNRDLVKDGINGFIFDLEDKDYLLKSISLLKDNPDIRKTFSENSKKVINEYKLETIMYEMKKIYRVEI